MIAKHSDTSAVDALALFGGRPQFATPIVVGRPVTRSGARFAERVRSVFERGWFTNRGPEVLQFEREIAAAVGVSDCVTVCNATLGLQLTIRALELSGEVIIPSFTFVATAHAIEWQGLTPVFCDIDPHTHAIDAKLVESLITPRTTAIMPVHLWGNPCDISSLEQIARRHGLRLVFDAAHAFGCAREGRPIGGFGDAEVFSFHATKFLSTFEGGAITTNDAALASRLRLMTNFGFTGPDQVESVGTNAKMSEISAAMGLASLETMHEVIGVNARNYFAYREHLRDIPGVRLVEHCDVSNHQYVVLEIDRENSGLHRDVLLEILHNENVMARRYFYPGVHRMEPYRRLQPHAGSRLPCTELIADRVLVLPTGDAVGPDEIAVICGLIRACVEHSGEVSRRLPLHRLKVARDLTVQSEPQ